MRKEASGKLVPGLWIEKERMIREAKHTALIHEMKEDWKMISIMHVSFCNGYVSTGSCSPLYYVSPYINYFQPRLMQIYVSVTQYNTHHLFLTSTCISSRLAPFIKHRNFIYDRVLSVPVPSPFYVTSLQITSIYDSYCVPKIDFWLVTSLAEDQISVIEYGITEATDPEIPDDQRNTCTNT